MKENCRCHEYHYALFELVITVLTRQNALIRRGHSHNRPYSHRISLAETLGRSHREILL